MKKFLLMIALIILPVNYVLAGNVPLPTTLDQLLPSTNYATVNDLTFLNFAYSTSPINTPPTAQNVSVSNFNNQGIRDEGIEFSGAFLGEAGASVDYYIQYTVSSPTTINSATLIGAFNLFGGTGSAGITEILINPLTDKVIGSLEIYNNGTTSVLQDSINFKGVYEIEVQKDITLEGTHGASISVVDQGYSVTPEPSSIVLWGMGLCVLGIYLKLKK